MGTLAVIWANPLARKVVGIACIVLMFVAFVVAIRHHWIDLGQQQGEQKANQVATMQDVGTTKLDRDTVTPQIQALTVQINNLNQKVDTSQQMMLLLGQQQQQTRQQVAAMTPAQIQDEYNRLFGKPAGSTDVTDQDRRTAVSCMKELPQCNERAQISQGIIQQLREAEDKQNSRYFLLAAYTGRVEQTLVQVSGRLTVPHRSAKCLWFCKKKPKLPAFDPTQLLSEKPK